MSISNDISVFKVGSKLKEALRLSSRPLCVFGDSKVPLGSLSAGSLKRCVIEIIIAMTSNKNYPSIYIGKQSLSGCPGSHSWLGFRPIHSSLKNFVSYKKTKNGRRGEFFVSSPEIAENAFLQIGKITPLGDFLIISPCDILQDENVDAKTIIILGNAQQIRNLSALAYFQGGNIFQKVIMPFGTACASLISYPSGMAKNAPIDSVYIGPVDPTINKHLAQDSMIASIPIKLAEEMVSDIENSFLYINKQSAFPENNIFY